MSALASGISNPPGIGYALVRKKPEEIDIIQLIHYNIAWMDLERIKNLRRRVGLDWIVAEM